MGHTGQPLRPVSTSVVALARGSAPDNTDGWGNMDQSQPDWVMSSHALTKIAILDLCSPSDVHQLQLQYPQFESRRVIKPWLRHSQRTNPKDG